MKSAILCITIAILMFPRSATAEFVQTFVSASGTNANSNDCADPSQPCATIQNAADKTSPNGRVSCIGPVGYSEVLNLAKPLSVLCPGWTVSILSIGLPGADQLVTVTGLIVSGTISNVSDQISISAGGNVILNAITVGPNRTSPMKRGISVVPNSSLQLTINDSLIAGSGLNGIGGGVVAKPVGSGSLRLTINRSTVSANDFGIALDGSNSTGGMNATIIDSVISGNRQDGIVATSSPDKAPIGVFVTNSSTVNNMIGVRSIGSNVTVRVENCKVIGNVTGLATLSGGALLSAGNNYVQANATNGAFAGAVPAQ